MTVFDNLLTVAAPWWPMAKWSAIALAVIIPVAGWHHANSVLSDAKAELAAAIKDRGIAEHDRDGAIAANARFPAIIASANQALASLKAACDAASKEPQKAAEAVRAIPVKVSKDHGPVVMNAWFDAGFEREP